MSKRPFTLLEVMVAIALLVIASGGIAWKMQGAVRKKQFQSQVERLHTRLAVCQRMAMAMQADWRAVLQHKGNEWILQAFCDEGTRKLAPLVLHLEILLDGKKVNEVAVDFFASGQVLPGGVLTLSQKGERVEWKLSEIFQREGGEKLGPLCPVK
jgi:prepilin-type N-terminal cleavage/methylation domain-containing protein